mgnify:CR=1 FL=1
MSTFHKFSVVAIQLLLLFGCGGGGGVQAMSRAADLRHKVFKIKMAQVEDTGANTMLSSCANCRLTMDESKEHWHWVKGLVSLVEVLAEHLDVNL